MKIRIRVLLSPGKTIYIALGSTCNFPPKQRGHRLRKYSLGLVSTSDLGGGPKVGENSVWEGPKGKIKICILGRVV
jgi:hypothetical protein